ncbi:P-loop NTPase fold protein [Glaciimonas sp. CA11.2]|uniref:P-loop NTPase fold protein n=1 Tax=Glaciimonas sp. CA11.2 TaxID=3048601 RepID=UPI002AB5A66E|nr:P-loop NTPase fold protein [Glaciimonas sp. CA11.2]MDY7549176.1 P-loop NTPase fold protein [Glaciimonas sp. CA11.2]MEB0161496.1 P-loop NTPase fold protein [Glaciimonas sp. CA11.2]
MSLKKTKDQLIRLLGEADNNVIALSGKWGTGKTHLWNEVKSEAEDVKVKNALYVSLFGLSSVDQVKRKLIESAIPGVDSHGGVFDGIKSLFGAGVKALSTHYKALAALNDLNLLLMAPVVLRNEVIVIDDIERKHARLGIDEVLGFIDEYSKQYSARFVLVLNDDQLSSTGDEEKLWAIFREKVIDHEVRLSTSAEEAFSIAIGLVPSNYAEALKQASIICDLTNIRIVLKVIKAANRILGGRDLEEAILIRVVPSIVIFSAIYYRGLNDGPDFKFVLGAGNPDWADFGRDQNKEPTDEEKRKDRWRLLMHELGINSCDEFEKLLVEFLESGLFDAGEIEKVIDGYIAEKQNLESRKTAKEFLGRVFWNHRVDDSQLVTEAAALPAISGSLDPFAATELDAALAKLPGGGPIGKAIIDGWITAFQAGNPIEVNDENPFNQPLHPAIKAAFAAIKAHAQANATVIDACTYIIENGGWGTLQEVAMRQATAVDFETAIRGVEIDELRRFMRRMIEMRIQRTTYDAHFGSATDRFVEACRAIANDASSPRLAGLIKRLFEGPSLQAELTPSIQTQP